MTPTATATATEAPTAAPTPDETEPPLEDVPDINPPDNSSISADLLLGNGSLDPFGDLPGSSDDSDNGTGSSASSNTSTLPSNACKGKRTATITLPRSYRNIKAVRVTVGKRTVTTRVLAGRKLRVSLTNKPGVTKITVRKKGHPTVKHSYKLCAGAK